jgi:3-phenylpropionate/trans-cinnamate dioxygenase ferredoxin subunit
MAQVAIAATNDIADGTGKTYIVAGRKIAIFHVGDEWYAMDDTCSHADASLGAGEVDSDELCVTCPRHGAIFDLASGRPRTMPAYKPVQTYPVTITDGAIIVEL